MTWKTIKYKVYGKMITVTVSDAGHVVWRGRFRKHHDTASDYRYVSLRGRSIAVHRLICKAFDPKFTYGGIVNHLDGNKRNNRASNLKCGTHSDNTRHAYALGLVHKGRELWKDVSKTFKYYQK